MIFSIVILNYKTPKRTVVAALKAINSLVGIDPEIIIVDNGSSDGSVEYFHEHMSGAQVVDLPVNIGFAGGMNAGMRVARGEYILLLNSDVEAQDGSINELVDYMDEHPNVGMIAPKLFDQHNNPSRSLLAQPTLWRMFIPGVGKLRYKQWCNLINDKPLQVEATEGAAVFVRKSALDRIGSFDEKFFFYQEIVDLCMRMRKGGFGVVLLPSSKMVHIGGESTKGLYCPARIEIKRSEYRLFRKHFGKLILSLSIAKDFVAELVNVLFYSLSCVVWPVMNTRRQEKLLLHYAVLKWLFMGMPVRNSLPYINSFGKWD